MSDFIVLGIIPGTNVQIGLAGWAVVFSLLLATWYAVRHERRKQSVRFLLIYMSLAFAMRRQQRA